MAWKNISFRNKLFIGFGIIGLLMLINAIYAYNGIGSILNNAQLVTFGNQLENHLVQKEVDHLMWVNKVNSLWSDTTMSRIDVQTDDHKCSFGKWLYGEDRNKLEETYPMLKNSLKSIELPHKTLHTSVIEINQIMESSQNREEGLKTAGITLQEKTFPSLKKVQNLLHEIRHTLNDNILSDEVMLDSAQSSEIRVLIITAISIISAAILALIISFSLTNPTTKIVRFAERMTSGDFSQNLELDQKDEMGKLALSMNSLSQKLTRMLKEINNGVVTLEVSSNNLGTISNEMSSGAQETSVMANTVATAAEEMSINMTTVASASEQAATNVNMVASASEEMSSTINEIAQSSEKGRVITGQAVSLTQDASGKMDKLGDAAIAISKVTEVITEISEQTNLLALNATIEAARAGEAGKGFAVVANEIKELAKQTAEATQEIKSRIEGIQSSTSATVSQIREVSEVIDQVNDIVTSIATAVEEQSVATSEIAGNVSQASQGIQEVNVNVAQSSEVAGNIAQEITSVHTASEEMSASSSQVNISAQDLQNLATRLTATIDQYKITAARFDIGAVKGAHLGWRSKLEGLLHGKQALKPEEVADHHQCDFGRWYDGPDGQALTDIDSFQEVGHHHEKVHAYAKKIVGLYHNKEEEKAHDMMKDFEQSRKKLFEALDELYLS